MKFFTCLDVEALQRGLCRLSTINQFLVESLLEIEAASQPTHAKSFVTRSL
jgi:hypothetical protein